MAEKRVIETDVNTARQHLDGAGTVTSSLVFGGYSTAPTGDTESWNGSAWTEVANLNTARRLAGAAGADNTSALMFGGDPPSPTYTANTEAWNGTSWTEVANLATARGWTNGFGSSVSAIAAGGYTTAQTAVVEEWTVPVTNKTITVS